MANVFFKKGLVANLPSTYTAGTFYVTTDERAMYLDIDNSTRIRLGDFIQVDAVANLPTDGANVSALYYCVAENILCRYDSAKGWVQINKQPTADEMKTLLGLGSAAYTDSTAYDAAGSAKAVRDYVGEIPEGYTEETIVAYINKKAEETLNSASGGSSESAASVLAALNTYKAENDPKVQANTDAIAAIKDGTSVDSFADVEAELDKKVDKVEGYSLVSDTEIARLAEIDNYDDTALSNRVKAIEDDYLKEEDKYDDTALAGRVSALEGTYTNAQIDELIQGAKDYADNNDADTKYGIVYDSENKKIKLVEGGTEVDIDATAFIKDGMIDTVTLSEDGLNLVITWNTDAGKDATTIPLAGLVDIYTGVTGDRITVSVSSDDKISADLIAGSISKNYLDEGVQASLAKADSALQAADLDDYAKKSEVEGVAADLKAYEDAHADDYTNEAIDAAIKVNADAIAALGNTYATDAELAAAIDSEVARANDAYAAANHNHDDAYDAKGAAAAAQAGAEATAASALAAARTEISGEIDADVKVVSDKLDAYQISNNEEVAKKANSADVYAKTETYTKSEIEALLAWSDF